MQNSDVELRSGSILGISQRHGICHSMGLQATLYIKERKVSNMWKIRKEHIDKFGEESVANVVKIGNTYAVQREKDNVILAVGKELKGYTGDIVRTMCDGWTPEEGRKLPYLLISDRHGLICKFK